MSTASLRVSGLSWQPHGRPDPVLDGVDLALAPGETVLLAGASGSGKSTLLLGLAGLLDPEAGELAGTVEGPARRAMLLQQPENAVVAETVARDVAFGPENRGAPRPEIRSLVAEHLGHLVPDVDPGSRTLATSGGQLQRIALAGALAYGAQVLALDEPTSMLDADSAAQVRAAVAEAARRDRIVIIAEHRLEGWLDLADRMILLGPDARIIADGTVDEVLARPRDLAAAGLIAPAGTGNGPGGDRRDDAAPSSDSSPGRQDAAPLLVLDGVALTHPDGSGRTLHADIDLVVRPGEAVALTGPSGSGKSTLLRAVLGLDDPAAGSIVRPAPSRIAFVPQNPEHSFVAATVGAEVLASPWADAAEAERLLSATGLDALRDRNPYTLSGGEKQRLALAAGLATRPDLLVLDEPTTGLDRRRRADVLGLLAEVRARGCAVLAATHDEDLARAADRRLALGPSPVGWSPPRRRLAVAARLNQLTMLAIGLLAMIGSFAVDSPLLGALALAPVLLLAPLAISSWRRTALLVGPTLLGMATLGWSVMLLSPGPVLSRESVLLGLSEALRIGAFVLPGVLLLGSLDPTKLGDALGQRLHLPARLVVGACAGLAQLETVARRWRILIETRRLRGLLQRRRAIAPYASALLALLVTSLRAATWQSLAMDARGFAEARRRTWAEPSPFTAADAVGAVIGVLLLAWPWVARAWLG